MAERTITTTVTTTTTTPGSLEVWNSLITAIAVLFESYNEAYASDALNMVAAPMFPMHTKFGDYKIVQRICAALHSSDSTSQLSNMFNTMHMFEFTEQRILSRYTQLITQGTHYNRAEHTALIDYLHNFLCDATLVSVTQLERGRISQYRGMHRVLCDMNDSI